MSTDQSKSTTQGTPNSNGSEKTGFCAENPGSQICKNNIATEETAKKISDNSTKIVDALDPEKNGSKTAWDTLKGFFDTNTPKLQQKDDDWKTDKLGLPKDADFQKIETTGVDTVLPASNGGCVSTSINIMGNSATIDPCPIVQVASPIVNWGFIMLCAISTIMSVLRPRSEES